MKHPLDVKWKIEYNDKTVNCFMQEYMIHLMNSPDFLKKFKNDEKLQEEFMDNILKKNYNPVESWMHVVRKVCESHCIECRNAERKLRQDCGIYVSEDYAPINLTYTMWNVEGWKI